VSGRIRGSALPKARQWLQWLAYHERTLPGGDGYVRCIRDTIIGLHHEITCAARRLRGNPTWDIQGTMTDDTVTLQGSARHLLAQLTSVDRRDIPARFLPLVECLEGAVKQQIRLAREIDCLQSGGAIQVDVSADASARRLIEVG